MDLKARTIIDTIMKGALTTTDVYVIMDKLFKTLPTSTIFSQTDNGDTIINFVYSNGLASDYLGITVTCLDVPDKIFVAKELTRFTIIKDDICNYAETSKGIKKFFKLYNKNNSLEKAKKIQNQQKKLKAKGIDKNGYAFIKDAIL